MISRDRSRDDYLSSRIGSLRISTKNIFAKGFDKVEDPMIEQATETPLID